MTIIVWKPQHCGCSIDHHITDIPLSCMSDDVTDMYAAPFIRSDQVYFFIISFMLFNTSLVLTNAKVKF